MANNILFLPLLAILATLKLSRAVEFTVTNAVPTTPGGIRFNDEVGVEYTKQALRSATDFIWKVFQQSSVAERKNITQVTLFIEEEGGYTTDNEIHFHADYIASFSGGDVRTGVTGELYHVMTHIWQWKGTSLAPAPGGLEQGIADFVRLKAGYAEGNWALPGKGNRWDEGYDVTARFLDYCDSLKKNGFVAELNKKMRDGYSPDYFVDLLGKTADQLWGEYKAQHRGKFLLYCEA